jgi:hypothetical protein
MKANRIVLPVLIGVVAALADAWLFSNLWNSLDWRRPIAEWISGHGFTGLAGWFGEFWIRIPTFATAAVLGFVVARLFPERWLSGALLCAVGFMGTSFVLMALVTQFLFEHPRSWEFALRAEAWSAVSIGFLLVGAWVFTSDKKAAAPSGV